MKKISTILILSIACLSGYSYEGVKAPSGSSVFTNSFSGVLFENAQAAFYAYGGRWAGTQSLGTGGKEMMSATVEQLYVEVNSAQGPKLVGSGKITMGDISVPTRSYMYLDGDTILLEIRTQDNRSSFYRGIVDGNSVVWFPEFKFINYDYQCDSFFRTDKGILMSVQGMRYVEAPQNNFAGMIDLKMTLFKNDNSYSSDKVKTPASGFFYQAPGKLGN